MEATPTVEAEGEVEGLADVPAVLNINLGQDPPTLDPSLAWNDASLDVIRNLFVTLTQLDPEDGTVLPYLATNWEAGEDAAGNQTWTFTLRENVPWVDYDPSTGEFAQATDAAGNPAFVTAHDVVYGIKRTLDPENGSSMAYVLYIIQNGQAVNSGEGGFTTDDLGVEALGDHTVRFTMESPAAYFPSIAGMWITAPVPRWVIEGQGGRWIELGFIVTNGAFALDGWSHGSELALAKSPLYPWADDVQIDRVEAVIVEEQSTALAMYENSELDTAEVPLPEIPRVQADPELSEELYIAPRPCTYYYGFVNTKPPFDNVNVRRAFSAAIDRQSLVENVTRGGQIPATSLAPPGIFGAPEPGEVGLGYDPELAQQELQSFLDEQGLTLEEFNETYDILLMHNTSEDHAQIAAAIQQMWADILGVDVSIENQEWQVYLDTINKNTPVVEAPHIYRLGWCADYADENNWVHEVFNARGGANRLRRNCEDPNCNSATMSEFDELTVQAQQVQDPAERAELYRQAEDILAREEAAYTPIYHYTYVRVTQPWLDRNYPPIGGNDWLNWRIDQAAKLEGTGN